MGGYSKYESSTRLSWGLHARPLVSVQRRRT